MRTGFMEQLVAVFLSIQLAVILTIARPCAICQTKVVWPEIKLRRGGNEGSERSREKNFPQF